MSLRIGLLVCVLTLAHGSLLDRIPWQSVFEVSTGSGHNVYDLWAGESTVNLTGVFKSDIVNTWRGVKKVKFSLKNGEFEVVTLIFDARNSDKLSWFRHSRLISSKPYTDLTSKSQDVFSVEGFHSEGMARRFLVNHRGGDCSETKGWLMVVDTDSDSLCDVETTSPRPIFLYSQWPGYANTKFFSSADRLVISVEVDDPFQWDMVFRATPGVDVNIFNLWTTNETANVDYMDLRTTLPNIPGVFKSERVNVWSQVKTIKVSMFEKGQEKAYLIFNAEGSDRMSWFSPENLIASNYIDILDQTNSYFSIEGHSINNGIQRRFYLMRNYASFCVDFGWFIVLDKNSKRGCDWDVEGPNPSFIYSQQRTVSLAEGFGRADVFAIFFNIEKRQPMRDSVPEVNYLEHVSHWTRTRSGCQCYFDSERFDCACCIDGGCQCTDEHPQQCVQCGFNERCGLEEIVPGAWTGNSTCACRADAAMLNCACCHNDGCQCVKNPLQCSQCGREDLC